MSDQRPENEPTELVFAPGASWLPLFVALGVTALVVSTFKGWIYAVVGAIVLLVAVWRWAAQAFEDADRLPRRQRLTSAVIPAVPLRRPGSRGQ